MGTHKHTRTNTCSLICSHETPTLNVKFASPCTKTHKTSNKHTHTTTTPPTTLHPSALSAGAKPGCKDCLTMHKSVLRIQSTKHTAPHHTTHHSASFCSKRWYTTGMATAGFLRSRSTRTGPCSVCAYVRVWVCVYGCICGGGGDARVFVHICVSDCVHI